MKLRVSADESATIYYIASLRGTQPPPTDEILDPAKRALSTLKPETAEIQGSEHATITKDTKTYNYHDTYLKLTGLIPARDYTLFMLPVDLNGNVGEMKQLDFTTKPIPPPVSFKLNARDAITDDEIKQALSLVTGKVPETFEITYKQNISSISSGEDEVTDVLNKSKLEMEILILPDQDSDDTSPYDLLKMIEEGLETLLEEVPGLQETQNIGGTGRELIMDDQRIMYKPKLVEITNFKASFKVQIGYTGTMYGIILPKEDKAPSAIQIRYGLTADNFQIQDDHKVSVSLTIKEKKYVEWPQAVVTFNFLFHSTTYKAYFIADRSNYGTEILMPDSKIVSVKFKTERELFKVSDSVVLLNNSNFSKNLSVQVLLGLLVTVLYWNGNREE